MYTTVHTLVGRHVHHCTHAGREAWTTYKEYIGRHIGRVHHGGYPGYTLGGVYPGYSLFNRVLAWVLSLFSLLFLLF